MNFKNKVLIVDDDPLILDLLQEYLQKNNYRVSLAKNREQAESEILREPDIILLDITLPDGNGLEITKKIQKEHPHIPVILISAKGDNDDIIRGLKKGADDYLSKPFNPVELLLRIKAILKRSGKEPNNGTHKFGDYIFFPESLQLKKDNKIIALTKAERVLLKHMIENPDKCLSRDELLNVLPGDNLDSMDRSIDIHITRLRKKIESNPKHPRWIKTEWGLGYSFSTRN